MTQAIYVVIDEIKRLPEIESRGIFIKDHLRARRIEIPCAILTLTLLQGV